MKLYSRIIATVIALFVLLNGTLISRAVCENDVPQGGIEEYIEEEIEGYLSVNGRVGHMVAYTTPVSFYDKNDNELSKKAVFVIDEGNVVGQLTADIINGEYASSYHEADYLVTVNECFKNDECFKLYEIDECMIMVTESSCYVLCGDRASLKGSDLSKLESADDLTLPPISRHLAVDERDGGGNRGQIVMAPVQYVANSTDPYGHGLCWAASAASVINYKNGNTTSYSASNVFFQCWYTVGCSSSNVPIGNVYWINLSYSLYGKTMTHSSGGATGSSVYSHMSANHPMQIGIGGFYPDGTPTSHSVVIAGIDYCGASGYYYIMDPNTNTSSGYVTISVNSTMWFSSGIFNYVASYGSYTTWNDTWV